MRAVSTRRPTLRDVARIAGVSHNTVSLVVQDSERVLPETKARVRAVIDHLGYQPHAAAAALRSARSLTIGYLIERGSEPEFMSEVDLFRNRIWRGITDAAERHDYFVLQANYRDAKHCRALLSSGRIDGLLVDLMISDARVQELMDTFAGPAVIVGRSSAVEGATWVRADEERGAHDATNHLLELGHSAIGLITVRSESHPIVRAREAGVTRALAAAGLTNGPQRWFGDWTSESGYRLGQEVMAGDHRPTAVFILSETMAIGFLRSLQDGGYEAPRDISVVTVGDSRWVDYARPALTAVHVPMYNVAQHATDSLLAGIAGAGCAPGETIATELVIRDSSGPPAAKPRPEPGAPIASAPR